ncbi:hypothetical protein DL95DRAFT_477163 [Leptodontidium sp. 2 PMI_412]|nr:hypothetical protein DL95DRAFT_477163 [Leptodontidium sp. 2 PMI_412]
MPSSQQLTQMLPNVLPRALMQPYTQMSSQSSSQSSTQPLPHLSTQMLPNVSIPPYTQMSFQPSTQSSTQPLPHLPTLPLPHILPHVSIQPQTQNLFRNYQLPSGPEDITYEIYCTAGGRSVPHILYSITASAQLWAICAQELGAVQLSTTTSRSPINIDSVFYWIPTSQRWKRIYYSVSQGSMQVMKDDLANAGVGAEEVIKIFVLVQGETQNRLPSIERQREWDLGPMPATFDAAFAFHDLNANPGFLNRHG